MTAARLGRLFPAEDWSDDETLVRQCLHGDDRAWSSLISKYANLIFSIPLKRGFAPEDCADIFQSVCVALLNSLASVREPRALAAWVINTTSHACNRLQSQRHRAAAIDVDLHQPTKDHLAVDEMLAQFERQQLVRQTVGALTPECQKLIELLFLRDPPIPYEKAAAELGLAKGSIGATRMRCLEKLRASLEEKGFT